jgi:hypothetical protein
MDTLQHSPGYAKPKAIARERVLIETQQQSMSTASERALSDIGVLRQVFSHLGQGYWLFASPVSKLWKEWYEQVEPPPRPLYRKGIQELLQRNENCIQTTSFKAAFQSAACVREACEHGVQAQFHNRRLQCQAGSAATVEHWWPLKTLAFL